MFSFGVNASIAQVLTVDQSAPEWHPDFAQAFLPGYVESFVPALPATGFVEFIFQDKNAGNGIGTEVYVNLRKDAWNGAIIGQAATVTIPDGSRGYITFQFPRNIPLEVGKPYFLEAVKKAGDDIYTWPGLYAKGDGWYNGRRVANGAYAFREGAVQPRITGLSVTNSTWTIAWEGAGVLEIAAFAAGPWVELPEKNRGKESIDLKA